MLVDHDESWRTRVVPEANNEERTCPDCGATWVLTQRSRDWFTAKRLLLPRRCEACRAIRRSQERAR
jgi:predicted  nucleic acid-binding Zn ribbon protein